MEETSDRRRAIGYFSVQIGRSCQMRDSSPMKGSTDVFCQGWGWGFESPRLLQNFKKYQVLNRRILDAAFAYTARLALQAKLPVISRKRSAGYGSEL